MSAAGTLPRDRAHYAGRDLLGFTRSSKGGALAFDPDGKPLGSFASEKKAAGALAAAAGSKECAPGPRASGAGGKALMLKDEIDNHPAATLIEVRAGDTLVGSVLDTRADGWRTKPAPAFGFDAAGCYLGTFPNRRAARAAIADVHGARPPGGPRLRAIVLGSSQGPRP